jgi:hypothetical protein
MPSTIAVRMNRWLAVNRRIVSIVGWACFAVVCADYARFVDLPALVVVPFWAAVGLNVLRWTVWEAFLKHRLASASSGEAPPSSG